MHTLDKELECGKCGNRWNSTNEINSRICPFCGGIIADLKESFPSFLEGNEYIKQVFTDEIFENRKSLFICLKHCFIEYGKEIAALEILYNTGISKTIWTSRGLEDSEIERIKKRLIYQLRMKNGMNADWAKYVIDLFASASGIGKPVNGTLGFE